MTTVHIAHSVSGRVYPTSLIWPLPGSTGASSLWIDQRAFAGDVTESVYEPHRMTTTLFTNPIATESADLLCIRAEVTCLLPICSHL
jgi:hypothetical protein